jgi:hypothetical protein
MKKSRLIQDLAPATPENINWARQGRKLVSGFPQEDIQKPLTDYKASSFSKWYSNDGRKLVNIPQLSALNTLNQEIHESYSSLYQKRFDNNHSAKVTLITAENIEVPLEEEQFHQDSLDELEAKIIQMLQGLSIVKSKVEHMKDSDFESVWLM